MTWTSEPPKVPGWYWRKGKEGWKPMITKVTEDDISWYRTGRSFLFAGPIPEPQEPPSGPQTK